MRLGACVGNPKLIFKGTELGWTEGPHLYHIGEYYYLWVAEGGTFTTMQSRWHVRSILKVRTRRCRAIPWSPAGIDPTFQSRKPVTLTWCRCKTVSGRWSISAAVRWTSTVCLDGDFHPEYCFR
jgi:hypothetical protein